ncbi:MAG: LemA family protein, partial [Acidimicrobiales bacterium]
SVAEAAAGGAAAEAGAGAAAARERPEAELHAQAAGLVARAEAYPELAANEQFRRLAEQLTSLEDDLSAARRYYNGRVRIYNTLRQSAPANLLAGPLGYRPAEYFQAELETPASLP